MNMEIRVFPVSGNSKLKAKANVTLEIESARVCIKQFRIHDDGEKAPWVGVPTERYLKNGKEEYFEIAWLDESAQAQIYPKILEVYNRELKTKSK